MPVAPLAAVHDGVVQTETFEEFEHVTEHAVFAVALYAVPEPDVVRPAGQAVQDDAKDVALAYVPIGHGVHDSAPSDEYSPPLQPGHDTVKLATPAVPVILVPA